jgi:predicted ArsR family transcriptional regulator
METESRDLPSFSTPRKQVLLLLKRSPGLSLTELAEHLQVSKVAALRQAVALEQEGLVVRDYRRGHVGRPRVCFRLAPGAAQLFPAAHAQVSMYALDFIEQRLGRPAVVELLEQRSRALYENHRPQMAGRALSERVAELARIRDRGGYMAEVGTRRKSAHELIEYNCPILELASRYGEACQVERRLFESLLRANVEVAHRVVAGDPVCRFLIRERERRTV